MKIIFRRKCRIKIINQFSFKSEHTKPALLIMRINSFAGIHENQVAVVGNNCEILFKLFDLKGAHLEPTDLGKRFGAVPTTHSQRIDITIHHRLKDLCKSLNIKKVIITRSNPF